MRYCALHIKEAYNYRLLFVLTSVFSTKGMSRGRLQSFKNQPRLVPFVFMITEHQIFFGLFADRQSHTDHYL